MSRANAAQWTLDHCTPSRP